MPAFQACGKQTFLEKMVLIIFGNHIRFILSYCLVLPFYPPRCTNTKLHLVLGALTYCIYIKFLSYLSPLGPENKSVKHFWQMRTRNKTREKCGQLLRGLNKTQIK